MLRAGSIVLSIWSGANLLLASVILATMVLFQKNAPILYIVFKESEIPALDAKSYQQRSPSQFYLILPLLPFH
jgi:hypothetical protein